MKPYPKIRAFLAKAGWSLNGIEIGINLGKIWNAERNYQDRKSWELVNQIQNIWIQSPYRFSLCWLDFLEKTLPEVKDGPP